MTDEEKIHAWNTLESIVTNHGHYGVDVWVPDADPRSHEIVIDCFHSRGGGATLNEALYRLKERLDGN